MSNSTVRLKELGGFLKARRSELSPDQVGLPDMKTVRRVPGLRREEVAMLAAISTDYYTQMEQGRLQASAPVLEDVARVLRLNDSQRAYLFELAGKPLTWRRTEPVRTVNPQLRRMLDQLTQTPALVLGRYMDILAWNRMAAALIMDFGQLPKERRNYVRLVFTHPALRKLYADWEDVGKLCVAFLHMDLAKDPGDPYLAELVSEISSADNDFRVWWEERHVALKGQGIKRFHHPVVGDLTLDWDTLTSATTPDQQIIVLNAGPGSPSGEAMRQLAAWAAENLPHVGLAGEIPSGEAQPVP